MKRAAIILLILAVSGAVALQLGLVPGSWLPKAYWEYKAEHQRKKVRDLRIEIRDLRIKAEQAPKAAQQAAGSLDRAAGEGLDRLRAEIEALEIELGVQTQKLGQAEEQLIGINPRKAEKP
ncbi:MAG: hypothetical protein JW718_04075 [Desulfovibrionaceae bacterium]|nr:hypothetical protein [Desulfovibrionaceae bacterium]